MDMPMELPPEVLEYCRELPRVFNRGEQYDLAFAQHSDAVADPLYFGQHMRRHENGAATITRIGQQFIEGFLHEGIKTFRGFIQNQQERVGLKRLDQAELSFHARAVLAQLSREIAIAELEALGQVLSILSGNPPTSDTLQQ